jgi:hypothetical protein
MYRAKFHRKPTVLLHVDDHKCRRVRSKCRIMRPVVWHRRQLTFPDLVVRHLSGLLDNGAMVVSWVQYGQRPDAWRTCCDKHERAIHQTRSSSALARFLGEPITRSIVSTSIAAQPHFGSAARLLLGWRAGRLDNNVVAMCFAMCLNGGEERIPMRGSCWLGEEIGCERRSRTHLSGYVPSGGGINCMASSGMS